MINYQPAKYRELLGEFQATVVDVEVEENTGDSSFDNWTKEILTISFELMDPETLEPVMHKERFVSPLTGGSGLFQKLLDAKDFVPDMEGGAFDEAELVGLKVVVTMGKRKAKNGNEYPTVANVAKVEVAEKAPSKKKVKNEAVDADGVPDDLPF